MQGKADPFDWPGDTTSQVEFPGLVPQPRPASADVSLGSPRAPAGLDSAKLPPPPLAGPPSVSVQPALAMTKQRRAEAAQRVRELSWGVAQGVLFLSFLLVAIVVGRDGDLEELARGDLRAAVGASSAAGGLAVEDVRARRRTLRAGGAVVIVTGAVRNRSNKGVPGARVIVRFGDDEHAPPALGWAWSSVDGIDVDALASVAASQTLSQREPPSASLAPGDRAPFVVIAPAPPEGTQVRVSAVIGQPRLADAASPPIEPSP